jgi:gamma-glutamylputrescine oxidase
VLLEANRVGWGASGRNGGQAIFGFASNQDKLVAQVGFETARRMFDVSVEALDLVEQRIAGHSIDCDMQYGHIHAAVKTRHVDELKGWQRELAEQYDYRTLRWLDRDELRSLFATDRYWAACSTREAVTCIRSTTRWSCAGRRRSRRAHPRVEPRDIAVAR